jgi:L-ribulose-5-phosphate 4-epimerase
MLENLKKQVCDANKALVDHRLVVFTWGNVSGIDRENELVAIKPSGIGYADLKPEDIVILNLDGKVVEGNLKPSSDTPTHLELYRNFKNIGGIVHTHSEWATSWAQAGRAIPPFGTTHADYYFGEIPCTRFMRKEEVEDEYEKNTGSLIVKEFEDKDPDSIPGVLIAGHGPFSWGKDADEAIHNAVVMEQVAKMAYRTIALGNNHRIDQFLLDKHYYRKHGKDAYYGQG